MYHVDFEKNILYSSHMSPKVDIVRRTGAGDLPKSWFGELLNKPDINGTFQSKEGSRVSVEMNPAESSKEQPIVAVKSELFKGHVRYPGVGDPYQGSERRTIYISKKTGRGAQCLTTDAKLVIQLKDKK